MTFKVTTTDKGSHEKDLQIAVRLRALLRIPLPILGETSSSTSLDTVARNLNLISYY